MPHQLDYLVVDGDNHYYERPDCFSRHIESRYADLAVRAEARPDGTWAVRVGDRPYSFMEPKFDKTNPPGSLVELLRAKKADSTLVWGDSYSAENMLPAFQQRDPRLELMDAQGVERALLLPTFGVTLENYMTGNVEQTYANLRAFNRWLEDDWGYSYHDRIFAVPLLSLLDVDQAVAELDRVLAEGARMVHLRPGPTGTRRSPADPHYDPFWARINEARIPVAFHTADYRYPSVAAEWGDDPDADVRKMSAFQWAFLHGERPVMEMLGALIYGNLFGRFPDVTVVSIENGSDWVAYLMSLLDKKKGLATYGPWVGGRPVGRPSDTFRQHVYVAPFPEDDVAALVGLLGAERVVFGSDYPHPEGLAEPAAFAELLNGRSAAEVRQVMRTNMNSLLGFTDAPA
ncbi:MAG TPA: amidohydrolase family protein [Ilumatobacter sp.]|nr:amidohydrolase family protein [Ilumatobacter sp.]